MIQFLSDIHLEFYSNVSKVRRVISQIVPVAPILVLAGDIGHPCNESYAIFLQTMSERFDHVLLVHGNHEYYHKQKTMQEIIDHTQSFCSQWSNVHFLNNSHVDLVVNGKMVRFIGSVLWSKLDDPTCLVNDAKYIPEFTMDLFNAMHVENVAYLDRALSECEGLSVLITHHLPSYDLIDPAYRDGKHNQCFASHCDHLMEKHRDRIVLWIYGHTHKPQKTAIIHGVRCVTNPIGYPGEQAKPTWNQWVSLFE